MARSTRWLRTAVAVALGAWPVATAGAQSAATLGITVASAEGRVPLQNARVVLETPRREGLTSIDGRIVFTDLPRGPARLRVLRIGYVPLDTTVALGVGALTEVHIELRHVTVELAGVRVIEYPPCKRPGLAQAARDTTLSRVLEQLRLNAEQYRYVIDAQPFVYVALRVAGKVYERSGTRADSVDTITVRSDAKGWRYRPGRILDAPRGRSRTIDREMHLPTLADFASNEFFDNHCFYFAGVERMPGVAAMARIDFRAAERLRSPDVDGSIWLDSASFAIRRAELELSRIPKELRGVAGVRVTTTFAEVLQAVPIFETVEGVTTLKPYVSKDPVTAFLESQRLLRVVFTPSKPSGGVEPTPAPAAPASAASTRGPASRRSS